jgi:hypothetical protein
MNTKININLPQLSSFFQHLLQITIYIRSLYVTLMVKSLQCRSTSNHLIYYKEVDYYFIVSFASIFSTFLRLSYPHTHTPVPFLTNPGIYFTCMPKDLPQRLNFWVFFTPNSYIYPVFAAILNKKSLPFRLLRVLFRTELSLSQELRNISYWVSNLM